MPTPAFASPARPFPWAPTLLMNGGLTAYPVENLSAALRVRFLDDRAANEDRSVIARGYTLIDLLVRYRWRNIELSFDVLNLADTDWRETSLPRNPVFGANSAETAGVRAAVAGRGFWIRILCPATASMSAVG